MSWGRNLTTYQVQDAVRRNRAHLGLTVTREIQERLGLLKSGHVDEAFVRAVADWREHNMADGEQTGIIDAEAEARTNILLPKAQQAADEVERIQRTGGILFDSWSNDLRDNDLDGKLDGKDRREGCPNTDGDHYHGTYDKFGVVADTYRGGWPGEQRDVKVITTRVVRGTFVYRVCADIISQAYTKAGVMHHVRSTKRILDVFYRKGYVFWRDEGYPTMYLPGDFIGTSDPQTPGSEGHSAIVVQRDETAGGSNAPMVVEMPGPSSQITDGTYLCLADSSVPLLPLPPRNKQSAQT